MYKLEGLNNGYIIDEVSYVDAEGVFGYYLGFCGCGRPEEAIKSIGNILEWVNNKHNNNLSYDENQELLNKLESDEGIQYVLFYLLDDRGLTKHGGSVPGWLTELGKSVLHDIKLYYSISIKSIISIDEFVGLNFKDFTISTNEELEINTTYYINNKYNVVINSRNGNHYTLNLISNNAYDFIPINELHYGRIHKNIIR